MEYHVLKRTIKTKGKSIHRWYYSYIDLVTQKKIQRVCDGVKNQAEAYAFISNLPAISSKQATIADITKDMFIPCSEHVKRLEMFGKKISRETLLQQRHYIELIIQKFESTLIEDMQVRDVTNYLMTMNDKSGSWKNCYIQALGQIFDEVPWHTNKTILKPHFPRFVRNSKKADIFTTEELNLLFTPSLLCGTKEYLLFLCVATCGLRLGEARALEGRQFLFSERALIVDGFCKKNGERTNYNKKGSNEDSKLQVVVLPDFTADAVKQFHVRKDTGMG